jgi:hypothetical protein
MHLCRTKNKTSPHNIDLLSFKLTPLRRQPRGPDNLTDPTSAAPAELLLYLQRFEPFPVVCVAPPGTNERIVVRFVEATPTTLKRVDRILDP